MPITKSPKFELLKLVVSKLVREPIQWGREVKIAKTLIVRYPDPETWLGFEPRGYDGKPFKVNCLAFFINGKGAKMLEEHARGAEVMPHPLVRHTLEVESGTERVGNSMLERFN